MHNKKLRELISQNRLKYYEVAKELGIAPTTFTIWLREPLSSDKYARVEKAIMKLSKFVATS